ncbi:MAG: C10 family peptidase, partial [Bacteroidales bacterium]|nr:C10 family peptidase [Bacteroidales bacterium]
CPEDPAGPGGHALVGCVATAMAQIMYLWRYPEQGSGSNSYYCPPYGTLSVNFGEATYEWDGMKNTTSSLNLPMALLSYHCGVGVNMSFGPDGSGIPSNQMNRVTNAFETYFNYSTAANHIYKTGAVTWTTWKTWIRDNLDDGCPVFYAGIESGPNPGGHAFVCDGYHIGDDNFHFNFGWGGYGNGWFPVTNPGGFPVSQAIVKNIYPADASYPPMCETEREISQFKGTFQDGSGPQENYDENADCSWIFVSPTEYDSISDITVKFNLLDTESDDIITIYDGESTSDPILGTFSGSITPGDVITSSGSKMLITFEADGDGVTGTGWQIEYDVSPYEWCEGTPILTEPTGILNDGSGDWYYSNGTSCVWQIEPDWADGLTISFTEFNTEEEEDVVEIRKYNWTLLASYSGEYTPGNMPDPVYIEDGKAYVIFLCNDANNNPGWTAEWEVGNVGVNNKHLNGYDLKIYPNPVNDFLSISFTIEETESIELKIFSVTGEVVYYENNRNLRGSYVNTIDLSEIAKGVYFLNLTSEKETINRKIIIN